MRITVILTYQKTSKEVYLTQNVAPVNTNQDIIKTLRSTASLLELYGENPYKIRSYQTAVYNLERMEEDITDLGLSELEKLPGVGRSIASIIQEINQTGFSTVHQNLIKQTPKGIRELLGVKGISARKIKTAWDELGVESPASMLNMARNGELADLPGFGIKSEAKIKEILEYYLGTLQQKHYKEAHLAGLWLEEQLSPHLGGSLFSRCGPWRRKVELVDTLHYLWATTDPVRTAEALDKITGVERNILKSGPFRWSGVLQKFNIPLQVRFCQPTRFYGSLVKYTGSLEHLLTTNAQGNTLLQSINYQAESEEQVYRDMGWHLVPAELREAHFELEYLQSGSLPDLVSMDHLQGIIHCHSTYSDGKNSLLDMARYCKASGYHYLGISDHSQSAVYANGLDVDAVKEQHREIEEINKQLAPFKIFKGIESDILNNGDLDYPPEVLETFDFIIASIHSNLDMDETQATERLIKAISNPFTTILGHPTGRQLLKRKGYPIDHRKVIDACADHKVIIEINAHPWRLDLEWGWVPYALEKGVVISINPDAHQKSGFQDVQYGINVARKGGLEPDNTFNSWNVSKIEDYFEQRIARALSLYA